MWFRCTATGAGGLRQPPAAAPAAAARSGLPASTVCTPSSLPAAGTPAVQPIPQVWPPTAPRTRGSFRAPKTGGPTAGATRGGSTGGTSGRTAPGTVRLLQLSALQPGAVALSRWRPARCLLLLCRRRGGAVQGRGAGVARRFIPRTCAARAACAGGRGDCRCGRQRWAYALRALLSCCRSSCPSHASLPHAPVVRCRQIQNPGTAAHRQHWQAGQPSNAGSTAASAARRPGQALSAAPPWHPCRPGSRLQEAGGEHRASTHGRQPGQLAHRRGHRAVFASGGGLGLGLVHAHAHAGSRPSHAHTLDATDCCVVMCTSLHPHAGGGRPAVHGGCALGTRRCRAEWLRRRGQRNWCAAQPSRGLLRGAAPALLAQAHAACRMLQASCGSRCTSRTACPPTSRCVCPTPLPCRSFRGMCTADRPTALLPFTARRHPRRTCASRCWKPTAHL